MPKLDGHVIVGTINDDTPRNYLVIVFDGDSVSCGNTFLANVDTLEDAVKVSAERYKDKTFGLSFTIPCQEIANAQIK